MRPLVLHAERFGSAPNLQLAERLGLRILRTADGHRARPACENVDPELFFSDKYEVQQAAKDICAGCPVRSSCLAESIETAEQHGIWGGEERRGARGRPDAERVALRRRLYDQGESDRDIARAVGMSRDTIRQWRDREGLPNNHPVNRLALTKEQEAHRRDLHARGLNDAEIAREVGVAPNTISGWRAKRGIPANQRQGDPSTGRIAERIAS